MAQWPLSPLKVSYKLMYRWKKKKKSYLEIYNKYTDLSVQNCWSFNTEM